MDFLYCNKCALFIKTRQNLPFYLTNCKHVFCSKCCPQKICSICQKPVKVCPIDKSMPESLRHIFSDVETLQKKLHECENFQNDQKLLFCTLKHGEMTRNMEWENKREARNMKLQKFQEMINKEKEVIRNLRSFLAISPKSQVRSSISPMVDSNRLSHSMDLYSTGSRSSLTTPSNFFQHANAAVTPTSLLNSSGFGSAAVLSTFSSANNSRSMSRTQSQSCLSNKSTKFF